MNSHQNPKMDEHSECLMNIRDAGRVNIFILDPGAFGLSSSNE